MQDSPLPSSVNAPDPRRLVLAVPLLVLMAGGAFLAAGDESVVEVGPGSYTTVRPPDCEPLPEKIHTQLDGPVVTNQWWSSLVWQKFSSNMFAHPLGMVATPEGLAVSYPGAAIVASDDAIMGGGVTETGDLRIGLAESAPFEAAECGGHSDWFVTAAFEAGEAALETSFGHGSPFVFVSYRGGEPVLSFGESPRVWSGTEGDAVLGVTVRGNHYGLFGPTGSRWEGLDGAGFTNRSEGRHYLSVALLPDDRAETLAGFRRFAYNRVTGTRAEHEILAGKIRTTYEFETEAWEGGEEGTVFALYPHQWKYTSTPLTGMSYASVRGEMKVGRGREFVTEVPIQGVLPRLPAEGVRDRELLLGYLREEAAKPPPDFADTYWEGKYLGSRATLAGVAEAIDEPGLRADFLGEIQRRLEAWFTVEPGETSPLFYYNADWGTLIGSKPSYGSAKELNDHHFHYGYFIRAAAEVARFDPAWAKKWAPMVELLIRDIASPDRDDPMFPRLRGFDTYAGHSWASGNAAFGDGNNQESSSESLNAWYGLMLWGEATGDQRIRDTGMALFNIERTAVEEYWFDVSGTNFPESFPEVALGMVWGGKGAFATWFSGEIDCIHGINWLPFTPASLYMGRHPEYVKRNFERIVERRPQGRDFDNGWGDLVLMFGALEDPAMAASYLDAHPETSLEGGNTRAFMHHWIGTLETLGLNDASVTADHPFAMVFVQDGRKTYAAHHLGARPLEVAFSDGTRMTVAPRSSAVRRENP